MHVQLDTDVRDKMEKISGDLGISVGTLANLLLRRMVQIDVKLEVQVNDPQIKTTKSTLRIVRKTSWANRY
jgi:hypothetical protein